MIKASALALLRMTATRFAVAAACAFVVGCANPDKFSMYPAALDGNSGVEADTAVVLVGNGTPAIIDYLQFGHSSLPAINVKGVSIPPGGIGAVPIAVGVKDLSLSTYTIAGRGAGYLPSGMSYGYNAVHTPKIDIQSGGVYYVATILADGERKFTAQPDPAMLKAFAKSHPKIAKLRALNFQWPK